MYRTNHLVVRYLSTPSVSHTTLQIGSRKIKIPHEIKRSPSDMLKVLEEATLVGKDRTRLHHAFIDDVNLSPINFKEAKMLYLAKEYGKRVARSLAMEWPTLFAWDHDEPKLEAFRYKKHYVDIDLGSEATPEIVEKCVRGRQLTLACKLLCKLPDPTAVKSEIRVELLQYLAYYNSGDIPVTELEEDWHGARNYLPIFPRKWNKTEETAADIVFDKFVEKNAENYSIMIAALCKYEYPEKARKLYQKMREKGLTPTEEAYNGLIATDSSAKIQIYLEEMNQLGVQPSVFTINAALLSIEQESKRKFFDKLELKRIIKREVDNRHKTVKEIKSSYLRPHSGTLKDFQAIMDHVGMLMSEMRNQGITPNLTTYHMLLSCIDPVACYLEEAPKDPSFQVIEEQKQQGVNILNDILNRLEAADVIDVVQETDREFFGKALHLAINANNVELADRVEKLYNLRKNQIRLVELIPSQPNSKSIGLEHHFYRNYFMYKIHAEPLNKLYPLFKEIIPHRIELTDKLVKILLQRVKSYVQEVQNELDVKSYFYPLKVVLDEFWKRGFILNAKDYAYEIKDIRRIFLFMKKKHFEPDQWKRIVKVIKRHLRIIILQSESRHTKYRIAIEPRQIVEMAAIYYNIGHLDRSLLYMKLLTMKGRTVLNLRKVDLLGGGPEQHVLVYFIQRLRTAEESTRLRFMLPFMRLVKIYYPNMLKRYDQRYFSILTTEEGREKYRETMNKEFKNV